MARQRLIKPSFFKHGELYDAEKRSGLPLRVAFAGLWTVSDRRGVFRVKVRELKTEILPYDQVDFSAVITALEAEGFIQTYVVQGKQYGFIPTFPEHQTFHRDEKPSSDPGPEAAPGQHGASTVPPPVQQGASTPSTSTSTNAGTSTSTVAAAADRSPSVEVAVAANAGLGENPLLASRFNELQPHQAEQPVADWMAAGIPLPLICETVREVCRRFKPGVGRKQPSSFAYFDPPVREAYERGKAAAPAPGKSGPRFTSLRDMTAS